MSEESSPQRLHSLDAYRGLIMILLATAGFGLTRAAREPGGEFLEEQGYLFYVSHPEWNSQFNLVGCSPWDLIQPAFMFMVGVSMPYSYAKRRKRGDSYASRLGHAWFRALLLVLLGVFLQSAWRDQTNWIFTNVLSQIGLGYGFLFFLVGRSLWVQLSSLAVIAAGTIAAFYLYGDAEPWAKNANVFSAFDQWFLNLFPRPEPFEANRGGYTTLNFIPSMITMILGVICGELLKNDQTSSLRKVLRLLLGVVLCMGIGLLLGETVSPIVKRIWTPSWAFFSGAYVIGMLAFFYVTVDLARLKPLAFPLIIVGLNPLTMYFMGQLLKPWTGKQLQIHLPDAWFAGWQGEIILALSVVFVFWLVLYYMYRQRFFIRV